MVTRPRGWLAHGLALVMVVGAFTMPSPAEPEPTDPPAAVTAMAPGRDSYGCPQGYVCLFEHADYNNLTAGVIVMFSYNEGFCIDVHGLGIMAGQASSAVNFTDYPWTVYNGDRCGSITPVAVPGNARATLYPHSTGNYLYRWNDAIRSIWMGHHPA